MQNKKSRAIATAATVKECKTLQKDMTFCFLVITICVFTAVQSKSG